MNMLPVVVLLLVLAGAVVVLTTTRYVVDADRLRIRRIGFTWMEIPFDNVVEIQTGTFTFSMFSIRMTQPAFGKRLKIRRKSGIFPDVIINPSEPTALVEAFARFQAAREATAENG